MTTTTETTNGTPPNVPAPAAPAAQPTGTALVQVSSAPYSAARADFELAQRRAKVLSQSTLVPEAYRGIEGLANCMIALNLADRIGADPFAVIQNLDVIHGRPGLRATFLIATVNACNRFTPVRFRFSGSEGGDDWSCRAVAKDKDSGEECLGARISIAMAKAEGWATKNGSKWRTMPEQMLMYRAAAFWIRVYAPELSLGIQTSEEVSDVTGVPMTDLPLVTTTSTKVLEAQLLGTRAAAVPVPPPSTPDATTEVAATPSPAEPAKAEDAKPAKRGAKTKADGSLPTGDLLPVAKPDGPERDPVTGEIVPPAREAGDDSEELR